MAEHVTAEDGRHAVAAHQQEEESAEQAFFRLEEIDELLGGNDSVEEQGELFTYLRSNTDLATALTRQETELRTLCDAFVDAHVAQADNICRLHRDYTECENRLVDFETGIVAFQRRLDATADDMVKMQQQIDDLSRSVNNRKQVSNKINEVYTALQECDTFCEAITTGRDVDAHYLSCLQELDHKLSFLCHNKELQHSAVDNELRPRLTAAARKAGDKLQRFLLTEVMSLAEDVEHVEAHQLMLEQHAQYAFRFLQLYNQPVAREIADWYVRHMSEAYLHSFRALLREFAEAAELHAHPLDPVITAEELYEVMSNRDTGAPAGSQVNAPPGLGAGFAAHTLALRDRSISQHMRLGHGDSQGIGGESRSTADHRTVPLRQLREASFADIVCAMRALSVRHGRLHLDATCSATLNECNSWVWRFVRCLQVLVNVCVAECRFIGNFFCVAGDIEGGEDYHGAERMARAVLERTLSTVERGMQLAVPLVLCRSAVLAALRMLDLVRQYLCTSLDPIPLLLLSSLLETTKAALRRSLRLVLHNDELALDFLPSVRLVAFRRGVDLRDATAGLLAERHANYAATLGPHPLLYRVAETLGELDYLNITPLQCVSFHSAPTQGGAVAYEPLVTSFVQNALTRLLSFITTLAHRHGEDALLQSIFCTVNVFALLAIWRELRAGDAVAGEAERRDGCGLGVATGNTATRGATEALSSPTVTAAASSAALDGSTALRDATSGAEARVTISAYMANAAHVECAEQQLQDHLQRWVAEDQRRRPPFGDLVGLISEAEHEREVAAVLPEQAAERAPRSDGAVSETHIRRLVADFSAGWQVGLEHMARETRSVIHVTLGSMSPVLVNGEAGATTLVSTRLQQWCNALFNAFLHSYLQSLTLANAQLATTVHTLCASDSELQARLVSNTTLLHEAQHYVCEL